MPPSPRSRRPSADLEEFEDDDLMDGGMQRQAGPEKSKQFMLDLVGRWHWVVFGLILGVLGGYYYLSKAPKTYQTRSTLLIKQQTSSVMSRDQVDEMDLRSIEAMNTVAERITRPEMLQKVASRPEIRALPGLMPKAVIWLPEWADKWFGKGKDKAESESGGVPSPASLGGAISSWTTITVRRGTRLLDIGVIHQSPEVAKAIADTIATEYQAELTGARTSGRSSNLQILVEESEAARKRLQSAQNALANYQRALVTLKDLEVRENLVSDLSRRYLPKHPRMVSALAEKAATQQHFLEEFNSARNSSVDRGYWDSNAAEWDKSASDENSRLSTARRLLLARGNVLESEIISQTSVFNSILTRIHEADINQQQVQSEMDISSLAQLPGMPVSPVAAKVLGIASVGGLGVGVLLAMFFIRLDNKIHTVSQLERETGLPVLAAISDIQLKNLDSSSRSKSKETSEPEACSRWHPFLIFREGLTTTTFAEMFRVLRASVSLLGDEKKRKITLFTSALPGEGKTLVSCNFALAAAQQGKRTLLIDLDLRKPSVHKVFGLQRDAHLNGVTEVLSGNSTFDDAIYADTGAPHLDIMLAGKPAPNPGELLNASSLEEFLEKAIANYDLVVIDSAPLLAVPDTRIIAQLVDNFCLVVRANYVPKGAVRRVISMLENDQTLPNGVVFNGFSEKRRLMGQNYSYGNYQTNKFGKGYRYGYGSYGASYGSDEK